MRHMLLAGFGLAAMIAADTAKAADVEPAPVHKATPAAIAVYNWTGCYIGAQVGGGADVTQFGGFSWGAGFLGGGEIGCNYQVDRFVFGIEVDGLGSTVQVQTGTTTPAVFSTSNITKNPWDVDIAARGGMTFDRIMIYNKIGVVFGGFEYSSVTTAPLSTSGSATIPGFLEGIGVEVMLTPQWSAKFEADVLLFSSKGVSFTCTPAPCTTSASETEFQAQGRIGLNYKFW